MSHNDSEASRSDRRRGEDDQYYRRQRDRRDRDREWDRDRRSGDRYRDRDRGDRDRRDRRYNDSDRRRYRERDGGDKRRPRSRSPDRERSPDRAAPVRRREPVSLDDVEPIDRRQRRRMLWDVPPRGFERVPIEVAKQSGLFALPGAPRPLDLARLKGLVTVENVAAVVSGRNMPHTASDVARMMESSQKETVHPDALRPSRSRVARRVIVRSSNPEAIQRADIVRFFTEILRSADLADDVKPPITSSREGAGDGSIQIDFARADQATVAVAFDGYNVQDDISISVRRPIDYIVPEEAEQKSEEGDTGSNIGLTVKTHEAKVPDGPQKLSITRIPAVVSEEQISQLLAAFGTVRLFELLKDKETGESKGVAFCVYEDPVSTEACVQGLNETKIGDSQLIVRRACEGIEQDNAVAFAPLDRIAELANRHEGKGYRESRVLQLVNIVLPEELTDEREYEEIKNDIYMECERYGQVEEVKLPRPESGTVGKLTSTSRTATPGVGKCFIKFDTAAHCHDAMKGLAGRRFNHRTVITSFYPEESFNLGMF
ncbi:hypothetical protein TRVA0_056S00210 [Trichomonascus vanleenenianus]|uniref:uncharacterized protein n=1 Tax=Trichomonascus vanleenenianus TaxID=2268995 RepID=UPI003EC9CCCD